MKNLSILLLQCLPLLATASQPQGYIYTHDIRPRSSSSHSNTLSSETAYSIFARRLGLVEKRRLSFVEDFVLEQIGHFGGYERSLFGNPQTEDAPSKLLVVVEGYDGGSTRLRPSPNLTVAELSQGYGDSLSLGRLASGSNTYGSMCSYNVRTKEGIQVRLELGSAEIFKDGCPDLSDILMWPRDFDKNSPAHSVLFTDLTLLAASGYKVRRASLHLDYTQVYSATSKEKSDMIIHLLSDLYHSLATSASSGKQESAIILLPSSSKLPKSKPKHHARQTLDDEEDPFFMPSSPPSKPVISATNSSYPILQPGTFLPTCFRSADSCTNSTYNCSGHGSCYLKHAGCYVCNCGSTIVRYNDDGSYKSVQWGGTACEKKDVSVPFFLFATFGIALAALVSGGIGMLYSMGSEELPSVIGAGVAGPRAK